MDPQTVIALCAILTAVLAMIELVEKRRQRLQQHALDGNVADEHAVAQSSGAPFAYEGYHPSCPPSSLRAS